MAREMVTGALSVVITGASAGVGRATALAFARRGWNVALIAREARGWRMPGAKWRWRGRGG